MLDTLYAIWCELGNLLGVLLAGAILVAVQELRKRMQKQLDKADTKIEAVAATVTEVARVTNGRLDEALKAAGEAREEAQKYRLLADRWYRLLCELNASPEGRALLDTVAKRYRVAVKDADLDDVLNRLLHVPPHEGGSYD
jgi:ATP/maltotriose-dependent transcriptional regulator MalT